MDEKWQKMYSAADTVRHSRRLSEYIEAGGVAAAVMAKSGRIYTGGCVDAACSLGICAERNAIFNMITNGEREIERVLALMPDGKAGAPCGVCRELMIQLMPESFGKIEILLDCESGKTVSLKDLAPEWWI